MKIKELKQILTPVFIGLVAGTVVLFCLFMLISWLILQLNLSIKFVNPMATICGGIGSFISGYISSRLFGRKGLIVGAACGMILSALVFALTAVSTGILISFSEIAKILIIFTSACFGGIFGVNSRY